MYWGRVCKRAIVNCVRKAKRIKGCSLGPLGFGRLCLSLASRITKVRADSGIGGNRMMCRGLCPLHTKREGTRWNVSACTQRRGAEQKIRKD
eukprot:7382330-Prymnesium_polylepis.2